MNQAFTPPARKIRANAGPVRQGQVDMLNLQPLPRWTGLVGSGRPADPSASAFAAGATLLALDSLMRANPPWLGTFAMRQALASASAAAKLLRYREDAAALRDAVNLARPGDDFGPAGRLLHALQVWAGRSLRLDAASLAPLADHLGLALPASLFDGLALREKFHHPVAAAAGAAAYAATMLGGQLSPEAEVFALIVADMVLAASLGWAKPLPLLLSAAAHPALKNPATGHRSRPGEADWAQACHAACALAGGEAHARALDLARRAGALGAVAGQVRSKGGAKGIAAILASDCVSVASLDGHFGSERAARRFLDRLSELGGIRELTQRKTFRLYGL